MTDQIKQETLTWSDLTVAPEPVWETPKRSRQTIEITVAVNVKEIAERLAAVTDQIKAATQEILQGQGEELRSQVAIHGCPCPNCEQVRKEGGEEIRLDVSLPVGFCAPNRAGLYTGGRGDRRSVIDNFGFSVAFAPYGFFRAGDADKFPITTPFEGNTPAETLEITLD